MLRVSALTPSRWLTTDERRSMIIPMLRVTMFVILVVCFLVLSVERLLVQKPTDISLLVGLLTVKKIKVEFQVRFSLYRTYITQRLPLNLA